MNPLLKAAEAHGLSRREFLQNLLFTAGAASSATWLTACGSSSAPGGTPVSLDDVQDPDFVSPFSTMGPLQPANADGIQLPDGFTSRAVAVFGQPPLQSNPGFLWHSDPDGGATFATEDGGWIYVSNAEVRDATTFGASREQAETLGQIGGGVSALRFDADGNLIDAYSIQSGTTTNCSGGATPWGTWINGEEIADGFMFEASPLRDGGEAVRLDRFGRKGHEMVTVDEAGRAIYHTEDFGGADRFYRTVFSADAWPAGGRPDMSQGVLQVLQVTGNLSDAADGPVSIAWLNAVDDGTPQAEVYLDDSTVFAGNEGVWFLDGFVFFSCKPTGNPDTDDHIFVIDVEANTIESIYNPADAVPGSPFEDSEPRMTGVDNIAMTLDGEMLVVEDGGDMRCMVLLPDRTTIPLLRLPGSPDVTEVTGVAIGPTGDKVYVSSQRALLNGAPAAFRTGGVTYEITMPFSVRVNPPIARAL